VFADVTPVSVVIAAPTASPVAPTSIGEASWYVGTTEQVTFTPEFTTSPTWTQTYNWESSTDGGSTWSGVTNTSGPFSSPGFTGGTMEARCQAVLPNGLVSAWVDSSSVGYTAPPSGSSSNLVDNEVPGGLVNSSNVTFSLAHAPLAGSVQLYVDKKRLAPTTDFTLSGSTLTLSVAPTTGVEILADYRY
jgi:hypothetical protein